jgi:hypothetical protein
VNSDESDGPHASATLEESTPIMKAAQYVRNNVIHSVVLESEAPESPAAAKLAVVHQGFMTGYERAAVRSE